MATAPPPSSSAAAAGGVAASLTLRGKPVVVTQESGIDPDAAVESPMFQSWLSTLDDAFDVTAVHVQSVDYFGPRVGFVKFRVTGTFAGKPVPGVVFMRGGAVAILVVLHCESEQYTLLCRQPRMPIGRTAFPEIPAGMLDGDGHFAGVAAKEMKEETGLTVDLKDLVDLTAAAYGSEFPGIYPSCGGCDEFIRLFAYEQTVSREELTALQGKCTGNADEHESIVLQILPLADAWKVTSDAKTLSALHLFDKVATRGAATK